MDLADFAQECVARTPRWTRSGIASEYRAPSDDEQKRDKWAAVLALDSNVGRGDLIVWTSGEAELTVLYGDDATRMLHYDLGTISDLRAALDEFEQLIRERPDGKDLRPLF